MKWKPPKGYDCIRGLALLSLLWIMPIGCGSRTARPGPSISFTSVPAAEEGGPDRLVTIAGTVSGASPGQQIVLFARSGAWWVQPLANQPFTPIQADSKWQNSTHLGTEYAALLVEPGYRPPAKLDVLPSEGGAVVVVKTVAGVKSEQPPPKTLQFSGYDWHVRSVSSDRGGRSNNYDPANAWTDDNGFLHLRIAQNAGQWTCAEVRLTRSLGYGSYAFAVRDVSKLEPAAVLTMYTWDDLTAGQNHREMDIEITRWGDPANKNAQYVVQPYYVPANVARFTAPAGVLTHLLRWEPGRVAFKTFRGKVSGSGSPVAEHAFTSGVPSPGGELVHLNLYIFGNAKNPLQSDVEVVLEKFEYLP